MEYKELNGTSYLSDTPDRVCNILESARALGRRIRLFYGDEHKCWLEEYDVIGYVGRSTGSNKIPIILYNKRSIGGTAILDRCIKRIQDTATGQVLYEAENFQMPKLAITNAKPDLARKGYTASVFSICDIDGCTANLFNVANFKLRAQAERWVDFMTGKRMSK